MFLRLDILKFSDLFFSSCTLVETPCRSGLKKKNLQKAVQLALCSQPPAKSGALLDLQQGAQKNKMVSSGVANAQLGVRPLTRRGIGSLCDITKG